MSKVRVIHEDTGEKRLMGELQYSNWGKKNGWTLDKSQPEKKSDKSDESKSDKTAPTATTTEVKTGDSTPAENGDNSGNDNPDEGSEGSSEGNENTSGDGNSANEDKKAPSEELNVTDAVAKIKELAEAEKFDEIKVFTSGDERATVVKAVTKFSPN